MSPQHGASRRTVFKAAGLGALAAVGGAAAASAAPVGNPITRVIPRTGERVPVLGMGTFMTFDKLPGRPRAHLREVTKRFFDGGGRVIDTSPLYGYSEVTVGDFLEELGIADRVFLANKSWSTGEYLSDPSHANRQFDQSRRRLWRERMDLVQVHSLTNVDMIMPILRAWKREGRIRYLGVTHHVAHYLPALEHWITTGDVDFVQFRYSIFARQIEDRLLRVAADRGTAVLVNMALEKARLHAVVAGRPLPPFAAEIGCASWAQFFLKYVISHPAVTCVLPATTNPDHMTDNLGALRGPLPDEAMRREMVRHMEKIPGFAAIDSMPWYPGKSFDGAVRL
ncbi:aldo/keto reductase [Allokutzneria sp. A3M-2-11 16]|uniref:aldo/keto reductase n=1 Tax=Allokutzneria sp. A3M-2-11 16 TaxID=2962043 RepID=UPI0020B6681A|nr:aldo/keto reductase [Allokutzneria sp. A3M-2-11 16]MCP3802370.1 aldo/keto reductase [Allokutzneria sp. A3M-2-11 16]